MFSMFKAMDKQPVILDVLRSLVCLLRKGPRSNFEIGGPWPNIGGGGTIHFLLLTLYNFKNIRGEGGMGPLAPLLRGPCESLRLILDSLLGPEGAE